MSAQETRLVCSDCGKGERHLTRVHHQAKGGEADWLCDDCLQQVDIPPDAPIPLEAASPDLQRAYGSEPAPGE